MVYEFTILTGFTGKTAVNLSFTGRHESTVKNIALSMTFI
jgi:hypothetical protein